MIELIKANLGNIIVFLGITLAVIGIIAKMVKDKKNGKSSCGCSCEGCSCGCSTHKSCDREDK